MKYTLNIIILFVLLLPCLLVLNESEDYWINIVGLLYSVALSLAIKYSNDFKHVRVFMKKLVERMEK